MYVKNNFHLVNIFRILSAVLTNLEKSEIFCTKICEPPYLRTPSSLSALDNPPDYEYPLWTAPNPSEHFVLLFADEKSFAFFSYSLFS